VTVLRIGNFCIIENRTTYRRGAGQPIERRNVHIDAIAPGTGVICLGIGTIHSALFIW